MGSLLKLFNMSGNGYFLQAYLAEFKDEWDSFLISNKCFTFQYQRKFLDFYAKEVNDVSILIREPSGSILAIIALAISFDSKQIVSHPKSSFGGIFFKKNTPLNMKKDIYKTLLSELESKYSGFTLEIRGSPLHLNKEESSVEKWMLWSSGFSPSLVVLHSFINLNEKTNTSRSRVKRVFDEGINVQQTSSPREIYGFWRLLEKTLSERHGITPVHSASQIDSLLKAFPQHIKLFLAVGNFGEILGGVLFFNTLKGFHLQYMAIGEDGRKKSLGDLLITKAISFAREEKYEYFGFGHSNEHKGLEINYGLLSFKNKFGSALIEAVSWKTNLR